MLTIVFLVAALAATDDALLAPRPDRRPDAAALLAFVAFACAAQRVDRDPELIRAQPSMDRSDDRHRPVIESLRIACSASRTSSMPARIVSAVSPWPRAAPRACRSRARPSPLDAEDGPGREGDAADGRRARRRQAPVGDEHDGVAGPALRRIAAPA